MVNTASPKHFLIYHQQKYLQLRLKISVKCYVHAIFNININLDKIEIKY